jgi:hypothetical protein
MGAGRLSWTLLSQSLTKRLHVEDCPQNGAKDGVPAIRIAAIVIAVAVAIFIATTETLAKVIVVFVPGHIITAIAVVRVLIGIRTLVVGTPSILPVCLSGAETLLITIVHGLPKHVGAVLIRLVVAAIPVVTIVIVCVEIWIIVVIVAVVVETIVLITQVP